MKGGDSRMVTLSFLQLLTNSIFSIFEFFIGLRILLVLFNASVRAPFVSWVYDLSGSIMAPFIGMFPVSRLRGGPIIDFTALFALLVYTFIHYGLSEFIHRLEHQAEHHYEQKRGRRE